jgi:uncharacterized protein (TIGR02246 family)
MRLTLVALLLPVVSAQLAAQSSRTAEAAIRQQAAAYAAAINKHDADAVARMFTANGDEIFVDGPRIVGRAAIRADMEKELSTWPANRTFTLTITGVHMVRPDVAIVEGSASFSDGGMAPNRGTQVMVRQQGKWYIAALRVYPAAKQ